MKERLLVGLDLGTSHIRIAVGQISIGADKRSVLRIIGATETESHGIAKGNVTSLEDAVSAISGCLEMAERQIGLPITEAAVGIGGCGISTQLSKGVIGVSRPEGDIRDEDVSRAIEAARAGVNPANHDVLHILPRSFAVDGQGGIKDPIGMQGIRLEVDVQIVQGLSSHIRNVTNAVFRTGLDVTEIVFAPLALAEAVTTPRQRELGVCVVSIGAMTTGVAVYENGELLHAAVLPIGADHITSDIAIGLRTSLETAERIKCQFGTALVDEVPKRGEEIDLAEFGADQSEVVPLRYIAEIIEARAEEIFEKVEAELKRVDRQGMLPAGVVLSGGGARLPGMVEVGKRMFRLPCFLGKTSVSSTMPEVVEDPCFATVVGLVLWSYENERREENGPRAQSFTPFKGSGVWTKVKKPISKIFKSFLP